jgi:hypothetical protein
VANTILKRGGHGLRQCSQKTVPVSLILFLPLRTCVWHASLLHLVLLRCMPVITRQLDELLTRAVFLGLLRQRLAVSFSEMLLLIRWSNVQDFFPLHFEGKLLHPPCLSYHLEDGNRTLLRNTGTRTQNTKPRSLWNLLFKLISLLFIS